MSIEHMPVESVQAYLLGTLGDSEAAALEERYFMDRQFFLRVQSIEAELIEDYLGGRLQPAIRERFESRYLHVPELRSRLEEVRNRLAARPSPTLPRFHARPSFVLAGITLILIASAFWLQYRFRVDVLPSPPSNKSVVARLRLSPGVLMGNSDMERLALPTEQGVILVQLDLPMEGRAVTYAVRLSQIGADGNRATIWTTPSPITSSVSGGRRELDVTLDRQVLQPGDYVFEVLGQDKQIQGTYLFRAVGPGR